MKEPTDRFSDRVENYVKYRPAYPAAVLTSLQTHCGLGARSVVADIGSGTGIFTELLLGGGCKVLAVEPNDEMRQAAEQRLGAKRGFCSVSGTAEDTGVGLGAVDIITVAQAFHWFRPDETQHEFKRILKPDGWVALVWNQRKVDAPFQLAYDRLLRQYAPEYARVNHRNISNEQIIDFLGKAAYQSSIFTNHQHLDLEGLKGRVQSSSYTPTAAMAQYQPLMVGLEALFAEYASGGQVVFEYETHLHIGNLAHTT